MHWRPFKCPTSAVSFVPFKSFARLILDFKMVVVDFSVRERQDPEPVEGHIDDFSCRMMNDYVSRRN